jgi:hypothetical protein
VSTTEELLRYFGEPIRLFFQKMKKVEMEDRDGKREFWWFLGWKKEV